jgi:regulatory protein
MSHGRLLLTIPAALAEAEGLAPGVPLGADRYDRLCRAADQEAAYRTALRKLAARPFAAADLGRRLVLKGHSPEAARHAVERAQRAGLLDDERFARQFIETRTARGRGPLRLRRELAGMGVDRGLADRLLAEALGSEGEETARIGQLVERRLDQLRGLPRPVVRRRLLGFLTRRGFAGSGGLAAVDRAMKRRLPNPE